MAGEILVASPRDSLLSSIHSAKGYHDVKELRLAEADIGANKALRKSISQEFEFTCAFIMGSGRAGYDHPSRKLTSRN